MHIPYLTYMDLVQELPFHTGLVSVPLPGSVIAESVLFSRQYVTTHPTAAAEANPTNLPGGYLQTDDKIKFSSTSNEITHIANEVINNDKLYQCAVPYYHLIEGLDDIKPLHKYAQEQIKLKNPFFLINQEIMQETKQIIINYYSKYILFDILTKIPFDEIDRDRSGSISKDELLLLAESFHMREVGELLVDALMSAADSDGSGSINKQEIQQLAESIGYTSSVV